MEKGTDMSRFKPGDIVLISCKEDIPQARRGHALMREGIVERQGLSFDQEDIEIEELEITYKKIELLSNREKERWLCRFMGFTKLKENGEPENINFRDDFTSEYLREVPPDAIKLDMESLTKKRSAEQLNAKKEGRRSWLPPIQRDLLVIELDKRADKSNLEVITWLRQALRNSELSNVALNQHEWAFYGGSNNEPKVIRQDANFAPENDIVIRKLKKSIEEDCLFDLVKENKRLFFYIGYYPSEQKSQV